MDKSSTMRSRLGARSWIGVKGRRAVIASDAPGIRRALLAALEREPRVNLHRDSVEIDYDEGIAVLSGEVADIAAKRMTLELAAALPGVTGIVDRLHARPAAPMADGEIADHLERDLLGESAFDDCTLTRQVRDERTVVREVPERDWSLELRVMDGIVTLDGEVPSLSHKRLAGVLAWWVPGSRDVINGLGVEPPEDDNEGEILDALRIVLEKDPFVDATQVAATCTGAVITLRGLVGNDRQKDLIELDAWYLFGVDKVINELEVVRT
jgi:osmotically-inducible protein OsmY